MLDGIRLTIDYPGRVSYWQLRRPTAPTAPTAIAQVGVTLQRHDSGYAIGGIVVRNGRPTADEIEMGDRLLAVDGRDMAGLASDEVMQALGGARGAMHRLTLGRGGRIVEVNAPVVAF